MRSTWTITSLLLLFACKYLLPPLSLHFLLQSQSMHVQLISGRYAASLPVEFQVHNVDFKLRVVQNSSYRLADYFQSRKAFLTLSKNDALPIASAVSQFIVKLNDQVIKVANSEDLKSAPPPEREDLFHNLWDSYLNIQNQSFFLSALLNQTLPPEIKVDKKRVNTKENEPIRECLSMSGLPVVNEFPDEKDSFTIEVDDTLPFSVNPFAPAPYNQSKRFKNHLFVVENASANANENDVAQNLENCSLIWRNLLANSNILDSDLILLVELETKGKMWLIRTQKSSKADPNLAPKTLVAQSYSLFDRIGKNSIDCAPYFSLIELIFFRMKNSF
jgi:hypothetical protein